MFQSVGERVSEFVEHAFTTNLNGYKYFPEAKGWLRLHKVPATWKDAQLQCLLEGGVLASPKTDALAAAMKSMIATHKLGLDFVFTGIDATVFKNDFRSLDGTSVIDTNLTWADGQPNNLNNAEDCLAMTVAGTVADVSCGSVYPYICHKENSKICGTSDKDYVYEPRTRSCYKFHRTPRTWQQAASACVAEDAHLVVINSDIEAQVLTDIFGRYPCETLTGTDYCHTAHVGFRNWNKQGEWLTIFGIPLAEAGFEKWQKGEPNNGSGLEHCGSIFREGLLNDVTCNINKIASICESSARSF